MNGACIVRVRAAAILVCMMAISVACASAMRPPLLQIGELEAVKVDGRIGEEEWGSATELGMFVDADGLPAQLPVSARLGWDETGLLVLWEFNAEPTFKRRDRDADFRRDDAVEVRLSASEGAPVYRFAVTAGGTLYDARDGDASWDAPWSALALRSADGWRVEMRIPFAALGAQPGGTLLANFAVHDADADGPVAAWAALDPEGAEPLGFLRLAATGSPVLLAGIDLADDHATVQPRFSGPANLRATLFDGDTEVQTSEATAAEPLTVPLPHPGVFRLRLAGTGSDGELVLQRELPLERIPPLAVTMRKRLLSAREIELTIDGSGLSAAPEAYLISASGAAALEVAPGADRIATGTLDVTECVAGELAVKVSAVAAGAELATETLGVSLPPRPEWAGSARGKHGLLMEPWTPVEAKESRIRCWDREYDFADRALPVSITSGRQELLAGPMKLRARVGTAMREWEPATLRWLETTDTHAVASIGAESSLAEARVRVNCDYDGLLRFDVKVDPRGSGPLTQVQLEIPVAREFATHAQVADGTADGLLATATPAGGWTRGFAPMVWLTGRERGLAWLCASDAGWSLDDPATAMRITPGRERTTLMLTMLDTELAPGQPFEASFALQATPARPMPEGRRDWRSATLHELPMAGDACDRAALSALAEQNVGTVVLDDERFRPRPAGLGTAADATLSAFADACHEANLRLMLVLDDDLTRDPIWDAYRDEVVTDVADARPCPDSAWADYAVEAAAYAMEHYAVDGIHLRGGTGGPGCDALGARALMMRLRTVVRDARPDGLLTVELPDGAPSPAAAFADALVIAGIGPEGEPQTIDELVARGGTGAMGPVAEVALTAPEDGAALAEALGLALLYDAQMRPDAGGASLAAVAAAREALTRFDVASARWEPWWTRRPVMTAEPSGVLVTTWSRDGEVLAVVANRSAGDPVVELRLTDRRALDIGKWLWAVDRMTGQRVPQVGDVLRMRMEPGQTALVHVQTRQERDVEIDE